MIKLTLPDVVRVHTDTGSHIEPPCEDDWDEPTKLAWNAAVVAHDTGLRIRVSETDRGTYCVNVGSHGLSDQPYHRAWCCLADISTGAEAMREMLKETDHG
ncbi:MAG: hypothetical protein GEU78_09515 [Actinobacteria bacterium]|nr:hypothetical protein [Actinomycetota bacterium]